MAFCWKQIRVQAATGTKQQGLGAVLSVMCLAELQWLVSYSCLQRNSCAGQLHTATVKNLESLLISLVWISDTAWCEKCQALYIVKEEFYFPPPFPKQQL